MRARVFVTLKPSVFDPQGRTIAEALHSLGYGGVEDVRQGKYFELDLATGEAAQAKARVAAAGSARRGAGAADARVASPCKESYGKKSAGARRGRARRSGAGRWGPA